MFISMISAVIRNQLLVRLLIDKKNSPSFTTLPSFFMRNKTSIHRDIKGGLMRFLALNSHD